MHGIMVDIPRFRHYAIFYFKAVWNKPKEIAVAHVYCPMAFLFALPVLVKQEEVHQVQTTLPDLLLKALVQALWAFVLLATVLALGHLLLSMTRLMDLGMETSHNG